ncbi:methyltransferase domain-containing protein [Marivita sp. S6314]|uniref:class I SAM-dependent DNA methyltransferase n=1 Tax=Marivita sp. S6314 TaxID=2926406 RepID=UPI001FF24015|nr:methyltransferase domain-containing protein [Marivita sp. S6314]MCK0148637.1 methyltransferase domain-containing protein [Marivita sp. S6314]
MSGSFLDKVYDVKGAEATRALYDDWSDSYEAEVAESGYATPGRAAQALAAVMPDKSAPVLDFGCGTGLFGQALRRAGFTQIDGVDLSAEMLEHARAKDVYTTLAQIAADAPVHNGGDYAAIAAVGVIGAGAAPLSVLDTLFDALAPNALICFSFNDHTLEDPAFEARVQALVSDGRALQIRRDYGDHFPKLKLNSVIYILQKT